jgi:hypothetical protein
MAKVGAKKLDGLSVSQSGCRLLSKEHFVEPAGKKDKSRVRSSVVT